MTDRPVAEDKAYAYITRSAAHTRQLLVFEHANQDAGVQVPKGTIEDGEDPHDAVIREVKEESGLTEFEAVRPLSTDVWNHHEKPKAYRRHFFHLVADETRDEWRHTVTGNGDDNGVIYSYFWVPPGSCSLARDMDDYIGRIVD